MKQGLFITFEGVDGSGKTTQLKKSAEVLINDGYEVMTTLEPGGAQLGKMLREILLHYEGDVSSRAEMFLYLADRAQHIDKIVKPALENGKIVLCDRHTDSTLAYQGYARGLDIERIRLLNYIATDGLKPDLTLVYDIDIEDAQKRVGKEKDRLESEGRNFHNKVRQGYLKIANEEPGRVKIINAQRNIDEVFKDTLKCLKELL